MYCSSRPKQPGFSFEALFPDELFPPGNKQKGKKYIVILRFIEQCASGSKCKLIVRTTYYILTCTCMSVCYGKKQVADFRMTLKNGFGSCSFFLLSANG